MKPVIPGVAEPGRRILGVSSLGMGDPLREDITGGLKAVGQYAS